MSRASAAALRNISPSTPSTLFDAHGIADEASRRASSHRADSSVSCYSHAIALASPPPSALFSNEDKNTTHTPANHDNCPDNLLNSAGSESSLTSSASSVFSNADSKMSYPGQAASLHALTPLTSTDSSPPGKLPSPRSANSTHEPLHATIDNSNSVPSGLPRNVTHTMTPVHTPPEPVISTRPTDGKLGVFAVYDPFLDQTLPSKERRKGGKAKYKDIVEKVRDNSINPEMWSSCDAKANMTCVAGRPISSTRPPTRYCGLH